VLASSADVHFLGRPDGALIDDVEASSTIVERYAVGETHVVSPSRGGSASGPRGMDERAARAAIRKES